MRRVGAFEAKTHFSALLNEVEQGETIVVTRNGKPVARMVPVEPPEKPTKEELIERMRARAARIALTQSEIRELIDEGRRF